MVTLPLAAFFGDWHPFQSPSFSLRPNGVSRSSEEGISVHFSTTSPLVLRVAEKVAVPLVSISFRAASCSFKLAGVKIPWKLSSSCYKALYSVLADKLEKNNPYDRKGVSGSVTGGGLICGLQRLCCMLWWTACASSQEITEITEKPKTTGFIIVVKILPPALVVGLCQVCWSTSASPFPIVQVRNWERGKKPQQWLFTCVSS